MTTDVALNRVDIAAVGALVSAVRDDPSRAATTWAAHVRWQGGFTSESKVRGFDPVPSDEPAALGGGDTAPNPVEQLLGALGNCLAVGYAANATVAGIALDSLEIDVKGDVDLHVFLGLAEGHAGFDSITARVRIKSGAPQADLEALHAKVIASSPVGHTLGAAVPVTIELA
ncbi:OsmC family protein [Saccharothrix violaceirubra]|uniref:Putative OsmC-like protein n=1 Tax=Saccharothrix violaceirubra TaxID=413306 RepID=A0A7W7T321_9PSEU|nr:OsmC family protein [Saccharothrix violaceirubra]MBB4965082.1 putative OsmC-like protein [Saccharothrix violaceirubra]